MLNIESVNLMQLTIDLAKKNLAKNKIPVAAIIVDGQTNEIIAKATNDNSPIGHAELKAIKKALKKLHKTLFHTESKNYLIKSVILN